MATGQHRRNVQGFENTTRVLGRENSGMGELHFIMMIAKQFL
jgi:hypothetical protein